MDVFEWLLMAIMLGLGVGIGFTVARGKSDNLEKVRQLELKLQNSQGELQAYREKVGTHFDKTAQLFNQLTQDYRTVYEHMAESAQTLCDSDANKFIETVLDKQKVLEGETEEERVAKKPVVTEIENSEPLPEHQAVQNEEVGPVEAVSASEPTELDSISLDEKANEARMIH